MMSQSNDDEKQIMLKRQRRQEDIAMMGNINL